MKIITILLSSFLITSCFGGGYFQSEESKKIWKLLESNDFRFINFSGYGDNNWTRVCFLGPYNDQSEKALGFNWHISEHTDVLMSDAHNVIVFVTDNEVVEYIVHSRGKGDFWKLSGECYSRDSSTFIKDNESGNRLNYVHKRPNQGH